VAEQDVPDREDAEHHGGLTWSLATRRG
jgi:hypothetical protein